MNIRQQLFSLAFFASSVSLAQSTPLVPFVEWSSKNPNWSKDVNEFAYVAARCSALYSPIGSILAEKGATKQAREFGEDLIGRGVQISLFAFQLARDNGWSPEKLTERHKAIAEIYWKTISSNRTVHNNIFNGFIEDDYKFCVEFERIIRAAAKTVK